MRLLPRGEIFDELKSELWDNFSSVSFQNYVASGPRPMGTTTRAFKYRKLLDKTYTGSTLDPFTFENIRVTDAPVEMVYRAHCIAYDSSIEVLAIYEIEHICSLSEFGS